MANFRQLPRKVELWGGPWWATNDVIVRTAEKSGTLGRGLGGKQMTSLWELNVWNDQWRVARWADSFSLSILFFTSYDQMKPNKQHENFET